MVALGLIHMRTSMARTIHPNICTMHSLNERLAHKAHALVHMRRVPEELKKHYLSDGDGGQYSTNLDRNRYGNDDNYLFTGEHSHWQ